LFISLYYTFIMERVERKKIGEFAYFFSSFNSFDNKYVIEANERQEPGRQNIEEK